VSVSVESPQRLLGSLSNPPTIDSASQESDGQCAPCRGTAVVVGPTVVTSSLIPPCQHSNRRGLARLVLMVQKKMCSPSGFSSPGTPARPCAPPNHRSASRVAGLVCSCPGSLDDAPPPPRCSPTLPKPPVAIAIGEDADGDTRENHKEIGACDDCESSEWSFDHQRLGQAIGLKHLFEEIRAAGSNQHWVILQQEATHARRVSLQSTKA
jgi:hypothetical protein